MSDKAERMIALVKALLQPVLDTPNQALPAPDLPPRVISAKVEALRQEYAERKARPHKQQKRMARERAKRNAEVDVTDPTWISVSAAKKRQRDIRHRVRGTRAFNQAAIRVKTWRMPRARENR